MKIHIFEKLHKYIHPIDKKEFYQGISIFLGVLIFLMVMIMYYHHSKMAELKNEMQGLTKYEKEAKALIDRFKEVKNQKNTIDSLLEEDKNFKLKNYFDEAVLKLNTKSLQVKEAEITEDSLQGMYTEIKLSVQFNGMSTKQLCQLLETIEEKKRIYTKELAIIKKNGSLAISLVIATLKLNFDTKE